jgi:protein subunit release factor A
MQIWPKAKMQLDEAKITRIREEIKFMLIPKDPEDAKT